MKKIIMTYGFAVLSAAAALLSCKSEPELPAPKFHFQDDVNEITVRRDTITGYQINADIDIPNGGQKLVVINGFTYEEIETIPIQGETYKLRYPVDFTEIDADTTFAYLFKVIDNTGRTFNDAFAIHMLRSWHPEVKFPRNEFATWYENYPVIADISTGFNDIRTIRVTRGGATLLEVDGETLADSSKYALNLPVDLAMGDNEITVHVEDIRDQSVDEVLKVSRIAVPNLKIERFLSIAPPTPNGVVTTTYVYTYDEEDRVSSISSTSNAAYPTVTNMTFYYNADRPSQIDSIYYDAGGTTYTGTVFTYDSNAELTKMENWTKRKTGGYYQAPAERVNQIIYTDGRITRYYGGSRTIDAYYVPLFGTQVLGDVLATVTGASRDVYTFREKIHNPFCFPALPPISNLPNAAQINYMAIPFMPFNKVRYSDKDSDTATERGQYGVDLDEYGRVKTFRQNEYSNKWTLTTFEFYYLP